MARKLEVEIIGDAKSLHKALGKAESDAQRFGKGIAKAGKLAAVGFAAAGVGVALGAKRAINAASDLNESVNAVNVVFGKASKQVHDFSSKAAREAGLSMRELNELVTPIGASLINMGDSSDVAAKKSIELAKRAADMASVFNVDVKDALGAIQAGLRGEADPLERFGVGLSDAAIKAKAAEMGMKLVHGELTAGQKGQARYALLMEQTNRVAGDFKNTSDGAANAMRIARAEVENSSAKIGQVLLPAYAAVIGFVANDLIPAFEKNWPRIQRIATAALDAIAQFWNTHLRPALQQIGDAIRNLAATAEREWPRVKNAAQAVADWYKTNLAPAMTSALNDAKAAHGRFTKDADSTLRRGFGQLMIIQQTFWEGFRSLFTAGLALISGDWQKAWNEMVNAVKRMRSRIGGAIDGLVQIAFDKARNLGAAIIAGIISGLKGLASAVGQALVDTVSDGFNAAKRWLESQSPSMRAARELGAPITQGMAAGIRAGKVHVSQAMVDAANAAVDSAKNVLQRRFGELSTFLQRAFQMKQAGQRTPTEKLIDARELERQTAELADAITRAESDLAAAQASGDPAQIAAAQRALDDARYNQWLAGAQRQAQAEREDLENRQWLEQQAFEKRLGNLQAYLESGHATAEGARKRIKALERDFGLTGTFLARELGKGFVRGLRSIEKGVAAAADALRKAAEKEGVILEGRKITIVIEEREKKKGEKGGPADADWEPVPTTGVNRGLWDEIGMGKAMGLTLSSGRRGPRFPGDNSKHIYGKAIDMVGSAANMRRFALAAASRPGIEDVFYSPLGGRFVWPGHDNHVHVEMFGKGGIVGGRIGAPQMVVAHGGETILPTHRNGGMASVIVPLVVDGRELARVLIDPLRAEARLLGQRGGSFA